jgi:hypothetical protein
LQQASPAQAFELVSQVLRWNIIVISAILFELPEVPSCSSRQKRTETLFSMEYQGIVNVSSLRGRKTLGAYALLTNPEQAPKSLLACSVTFAAHLRRSSTCAEY